MADAGGIDFASLLQNPLFMGGVQGLLAPSWERGSAFMKGMQGASTLKTQQQQQELNALKLQQARAQANFNPADYMQTTPTPQGTGIATPTALQGQQQAPQMPSTLGGPLGGQTQMQPPSPMAAPVQPEPGMQTGRVNMMGLLQGGMQAGMNPAEVSQLGSIMDPQMAAQMALAQKLQEPYTLAPGQTRMAGNQTLGANTNAPPSDPSAVLARTQAAAAQARAAGNTVLADQLDASAQKLSGQFDQQTRQAQMEATAAQRDITNGMRNEALANRSDTIANTQEQRKFQNDQKVQTQVINFSNQLQKTGLPAVDQNLSDLEALMAKYPPGKLPGVGRVEGLLPISALSEDGQQVRQLLAKVQNVDLRNASGLNVTGQELQRDIKALGSGPFMPEERLRQGIGQVRKTTDAQLRNAQAGLSSDELATYTANGGMDFSRFRPKASPSLAGASLSDIDAAIAKKMGK